MLTVIESNKPVSRVIGGFLRPVDHSPISSHFWEFRKDNKYHKGIDFACVKGTEVRAMTDGVIYRAGWQSPRDHTKGFGLRVWQRAIVGYEKKEDVIRKLKTPLKIDIFYGHLCELNVGSSDKVNAGDIVGFSGNTGVYRSEYKGKGYHLHVGIRKLGTYRYYDMEFVYG